MMIWLVVKQPTPLKIMDFVRWDDEIPNCFWKVNPNSMVPVSTNQSWSHDDPPLKQPW